MKASKKPPLKYAAVVAFGVAVALSTAGLFERSQSFTALFTAGEKDYLAHDYSRALSNLSAAHARNPSDEKTTRYLSKAYSALGRSSESAALLASLPSRSGASKPLPPLKHSRPDRNTDPGATSGAAAEGRPADWHPGAVVHPIARPSANDARHQADGSKAAQLRKEILQYEVAAHPEKTLELYEALLRLEPDEDGVSLGAARNYGWSGKYERSLQLYRQLLSRHPADVAMRAEYATVLYWDQQYARAAVEYREALKHGSLKKEHSLNYSLTLLALGDPLNLKRAVATIDSLVKENPSDFPLLLAAADAYATASAFEPASRLYRQAAARNPNDPLPETRLAGIAIAAGNNPEAKRISLGLLARFAGNRQAMLTLARVSSWEGDYKSAISYYDQLLNGASRSEALVYFREKARVLKWKKDYGRSQDLYREAVSAYPENNALRAEAEAERYYYRSAFRHAEPALRAWLASEPDNGEALFELGQIFIEHADWKNARQTYDRLLAVFPNHRDAAVAKRKIGALSSMTLLNAGAEHFSARSEDRRADVAYSELTTSLSRPVQERVSVFVQQDRKSYHFDTSPIRPTSESLMAGAEFRSLPDIVIRAAYGLRLNSGYLKEKQNGYFEAESTPLDNLHIGAALRRSEVVENPATFMSMLEKTSWQAHATLDPYRRWSAGVDFGVENYSDRNRKSSAGGEVAMHLFYDPTRLTVLYRLQDYGFSTSSRDYFSPGSFVTHSAAVEWQHYLNPNGIYRGGNDTWYSASYRLTREPDQNWSHQLRASLSRDWNERFNTALHYQRTWNNRTDIYSDEWLKGEVKWFF
ncbi:MAG: tetratricopeptide repeat protein [Chlorobiaceae bacterium]